MSAQDRFAQYLRDEARLADERSATADDGGPDVKDIAARNATAADQLRKLADSLGSMSSEERQHLEAMSDTEMRSFAKATRLLAGRED